jgi:Tol biopolymer transport system component
VRQLFPASGQERAHAFDGESDMVIYDVDKNEFFTSPLLFSKEAYESSPCFSPDGKTLYFITAPAVPMPREEKNIRYSLCSIGFDAATAKFGTNVDTLISARKLQKSVAFPRISPDGKHILVTLTDHGNFPAYNKDADLYMYHLADATLEKLNVLNSPDVESYHSWSSTGRWIVFSSRRLDGLYMNCYLAHVDEKGNPQKPILLPQEDADFYKNFLFSFNLPEFAVKKVDFDRYEFEKVAKQTAGSQVSFDNYH